MRQSQTKGKGDFAKCWLENEGFIKLNPRDMKYMCLLYLVCFSGSVINHWPNQFKGRKGFIWLTHSCHSSSSRKVRAGVWSRDQDAMLLPTELSSIACSALLSYTIQDQLPGDCTAHSMWGPSTSVINQENASSTCPHMDQYVEQREFSNWGFSSGANNKGTGIIPLQEKGLKSVQKPLLDIRGDLLLTKLWQTGRVVSCHQRHCNIAPEVGSCKAVGRRISCFVCNSETKQSKAETRPPLFHACLPWGSFSVHHQQGNELLVQEF